MSTVTEREPALTASPDSNQDDNKTISVSAFDLPQSSFLSEETRQAIRQFEKHFIEYSEKTAELCPLSDSTPIEDLAAIRQAQAELFYTTPLYKTMRERYSVSIQPETIAGVDTEVFTPTEGVAPEHEEHVLINLHGGAFIHGARTFSQLESIPIAALGKIKVISIDYRMAPEYPFPAASDDVLAVYKELLQDYQPENIVIYGCSAGALLTTQVIARLQQETVPLPAAIGMSSAASYFWMSGDSGYFSQGITGLPVSGAQDFSYFKHITTDDALAFPGTSTESLKKFPPSLLMSSTRDYALSSVVYTHSQLIKLGVEADLHVWEGLDHGFLYSADLPESHEAYTVMVNFFNKHLGRRD